MKRTLIIDIEDEPSTVTYELKGGEELSVTVEGQAATLYVNQAGGETLARILAKLALGGHEPGFHVHLKTDFGEDPAPDVLTIVKTDAKRQGRS